MVGEGKPCVNIRYIIPKLLKFRLPVSLASEKFYGLSSYAVLKIFWFNVGEDNLQARQEIIMSLCV